MGINDIISHILDGNLWIAYVIIVGYYLIPNVRKKHRLNPRFKNIPSWAAFVFLIIILLYTFKLISLSCTWLMMLASFIVIGYAYAINTTIKASYEYWVLKRIEKKLITQEVESFEAFYKKYNKCFITTIASYRFKMFFIGYVSDYGVSPLCFEILDEIEIMNLTDSERRKSLHTEFEIYSNTSALRIWEDKYDIDSLSSLTEKDKLLIKSILLIEKLELCEAESLLRKLLSKSNNDNHYKRIAEINLAAIAERKGNKLEMQEYALRSQLIRTNSDANNKVSSYNTILSYISSNQLDKAAKSFDKYISSFPSYTIEQRIRIENEKQLYYRKIGDIEEIEKSIKRIFIEYKKASKEKKYNLLISLLRMTFSFQVYFGEILDEIEVHLEDILNINFDTTLSLSKESLGIARLSVEKPYSAKIINILDTSIAKLKTFDYDLELSKIRNEEVLKKREYIKFKGELLYFEPMSEIVDEEARYEKIISNKLVILDHLIDFDKKNIYAFNQLESLFIKLDETTTAINICRHKSCSTSFVNTLKIEANKSIDTIKEIMKQAYYSMDMAEYHLQLAHHYCMLNDDESGFIHFQQFQNSNVGILNYANWLKEWYYNLSKHFKNHITHN